MKFSNYVKYGLIALPLLAGSYVGVKYTWDKAYMQGVDDVFRYCHDSGGVLHNQITQEVIGCGPIVVQTPQKMGDPV